MMIGVRKNDGSVCPTFQELRRFFLGQVSGSDLEAVSAHVEACSKCVERLDELDDFSDTFVAGFRTEDADNRATSNRPTELPLIDQTIFSSQFDVTSLSTDARSDVASIVRRAMALPIAQQVPDSIGPYEILGLIGRGGMGTVYRAKHTTLGVEKAIKVIPEGRETSAELAERFQRELQTAANVSHPNLVTATDAGTDSGFHYFAMEYVDGADASTLVHEHGRLGFSNACEIVRQSALGLEHLHGKGLIHRDIKPSNLRVTKDGAVKVLDLGLARHLPGFAELGDFTAVGHVMGTHNYMSPEQIQSEDDIDQRSDIYSLGCTLYHLLCGEAPFSQARKRNVMATLVAHCTDEAPSLLSLRPDIPVELESVVLHMLAKSPADRIGSAREVVKALEPFTVGACLAELHVSESRHIVDQQTTKNHLADPLVATHPATKVAEPQSLPSTRSAKRPLKWFYPTVGICAVLVTAAFAWSLEWNSEPSAAQVHQLKAGEIHPLLQQKPIVTWRDGPADGPDFVHDGVAETVHMVATSQRLIRLGEAKDVTFEWGVQIHQVHWEGNTGVYFGLRFTGENQILYNRLVIKRIGPQSHQLIWQRVTALVSGGSESAVTIAVAPIHELRGAMSMYLLFDQRGLGSVAVDGVDVVWKDLAPKRSYSNEVIRASAWGEFGLWNHRAGTVFRRAVTERFIKHD